MKDGANRKHILSLASFVARDNRRNQFGKDGSSAEYVINFSRSVQRRFPTETSWVQLQLPATTRIDLWDIAGVSLAQQNIAPAERSG
jgi:hypothetical protein